jgi:D-glycero-alpha-D-manno-heptose 1-phosphate guanylyltransferase
MLTIILAGGLGTRLWGVIPPLLPKVMAPINGKPFLEHLIRLLTKRGILLNDIVLSLGYQSQQIIQYFETRYKELHYFEESQPLGTAGSVGVVIRHCMKEGLFTPACESAFMVLNGDTYLDIDYDWFMSKHLAGTAIASTATTKVPDTSRFSRLEIDKKNLITNLAGKGLKGKGYISSGAFIFSKTAINAFPEKGNLEDDVLKKFVDLKLCYGIHMRGKFIDMGTPESYEKCKRSLRKF